MRFATVIVLALVLLASCGGSGTSSDGTSAHAAPVPVTTAPSASSGSTSPALLRAAFVDTAAGPRILAAGTDPSTRLETVLFELLDANGNPATIVDGNGYTEPPEIEIPRSAMSVATDGTFVVEIDSSPTLVGVVATVTATARDIDGAQGTTLKSSLVPLPVRNVGEACSLQGFDACADGLVCDDTMHCSDLGMARATRCANAPVIAIGGTFRGIAAGASLWDPIAGCSSAERRGRPEGVARLHLDAPVASLTLRTVDGTAIDSVLSLLSDCSATPTSLVCNDDDPPPFSRVVLSPIPAGDYVVVVDSLDRAGGAFVLTATSP